MPDTAGAAMAKDELIRLLNFQTPTLSCPFYLEFQYELVDTGLL
jgi:hypothetical protein